MANILVIRLSAIGDVAMTVPVIYSVAKENPEDHFTVLTQSFLTTLFINKPANIELIGIDTRGEQRHLIRLIRFAWKLSAGEFDYVLDLHDVLRTKLIRNIFRLKNRPVFVLDKARKEKQELTRKKNKIFKPLVPVIHQYASVFMQAGLKYKESFSSLFEDQNQIAADVDSILVKDKTYHIGIAPFAKHRGKIWPIDEMEKVIGYLSRREDTAIYLFGGKGYEEAVLDDWSFLYPNINPVVGKYPLDTELKLISSLDFMLTMDSANMHFASLVGTRVISIWGATHPYAGFYGYKQDPTDCIQLDLFCRPCSVYGQKNCYRGDWACMNRIKPEEIIKKIERIIGDDK